MRRKIILSIFAFISAFSLAVLITPSGISRIQRMYEYRVLGERPMSKPCTVPEPGLVQKRITEVIKTDLDNGRRRNAGYDYSADSYDGILSHSKKNAKLVSEYVRNSSSIDLSNLPEDFQKAWCGYMAAWKKKAEFMQLSSDPAKRSKITREQRVYYANSSLEISSSWMDVLDTARKYGAEIPPGA